MKNRSAEALSVQQQQDLLTHPLGICRQSYSWSRSCDHSTEKGNDRLHLVVWMADSTEPRTFRRHMTARPNASSLDN